MDSSTKGAWIIHHGRKVAASTAAGEFSAIDLAAKAATMLSRMSATDEVLIQPDTVKNLAKFGGLNPKTELEAVLGQLQDRRLIDRSKSGEVVVLGVSTSAVLTHAAELFESNGPEKSEIAAIDLAEITSEAPMKAAHALDVVRDQHKLSKDAGAEFLEQAQQIGFVDSEGENADRLLFNGNLFRREYAGKAAKILESLKPDEQQKLLQLQEELKQHGAVGEPHAKLILGDNLFSKLKAAAVLDSNVVSNENGEHVFVTSPGAFHKFVSPLEDDSFNHAKALVAALKYGIAVSHELRGRIWGVDYLLRKLIRGESVGPAPAIGQDYRALEVEGVLRIVSVGGGYYRMSLRKREVGEIALQVLMGGSAAAATALEMPPTAGIVSYTDPETSRTKFRQKKQTPASKKQMQDLLRSMRSGGL